MVFAKCRQAAYVVGIADPASEPGRPGLVDQSQFARVYQAIQMTYQNLTNPSSTQQQVSVSVSSAANCNDKQTFCCRLFM